MKIPKHIRADKKFCVLLIERSIDHRNFLSKAIKSSENFIVKSTSSIEDAFDFLSKHHNLIHFILFNWNMPGMKGNIFAQNIRRNIDYDHIELIVFSKDLKEEDLFLMTEMNIHYSLPKITSGTQLVEKLNHLLSDYHLINPVQKKLKELQHWIHEENLEKCEEILQDEKIKYKIKNNAKFLYLKGEILILRKNYSEAVKFFESIMLDKKKLNVLETLRTLSTMGKAYCLAGKYQEALMIFEKLETKSPKNLNHKLMTGEALLGLEKFHMAQEKFHEVLEVDPKDKNALIGMVKSCSSSGNYSIARAYFNKIKTDFESKAIASYFNNRGVLLVRKNRIDEAIIFYNHALYFFEKFEAQIYFNLGMAYFRANNIEKSANCFRKALSSKDFDLITEKTLIKEFQEEGIEKFIEKFKNNLKKNS